MTPDDAKHQRPPDAPEEQDDSEQSELDEFRKDFSFVVKATAKATEQMNNLIESQNASYAAAIRLALLASASNLVAWMLTLLLIVFGNPTWALVPVAALFGVLAVVFFWLAFNARFINWLKNKFERRKRR